MNLIKSQVPVSVVIPCYKCSSTIKRAIDSVYNQSWRPAEVILIEDGSADGTLELLYDIQKQHTEGWIKVIPLKKNSGPSIARNTGWDIATQDYIAFLDSDDSWHPQKTEIQLQWMLDNPTVALSGCGFEILSKEEESKTIDNPLPFYKVKKELLLLSNRFPTPSVMLKRNINIRFNVNKKHSEDYLLWLEICLGNQPCYRSDAKLIFLYKNAYGVSGLSGNLIEMEKGELDNYQHLYNNLKITLFQKNLFKTISVLKFTIRLLKSKIKNQNRIKK